MKTHLKILSFLLIIILSSIQPFLSANGVKGAEYRTKLTYIYGRFEVRMKSADREGILSSFFTYFDGTPTDPWSSSKWNEIDIEILGRYDNQVQFNIITLGQTNHVRANLVNFNPAIDFHTYAFEWTPAYVAWFIDGAEVYRQTQSHIQTLTREQIIMMNIWNPDYANWVGKWDPLALPAFAYYDWMTYYSYTPGSGNYGTSNNFSYQWKDEFDSFDDTRWEKSTHTFSGNNCDFIPENVVFNNGKMVLCLTDATNLGFVDKQSPSILWARADEEKVMVAFTEALNKTSAETKSKYLISGVTINSAELLPDNSTVKLSISGLNPLNSYNLIAVNIIDTNAVPNNMSGKVVPLIMAKPLSFPVKINAGGGAAQGFLANQNWDAATEYGYMDGNSSEYPATLQIYGTNLDSIYRSDQYGLVAYRIRVPNGKYNLRLMFAEKYFSSPQQRVFDVFIQGNLILNNLDIYKQVGMNTAYDIVANNIEVGNEILEINFSAEVDNAMLNGLIIESVTTGVKDDTQLTPEEFYLEQNYPNPFNGKTVINYSLASPDNISIELFNILGEQIFFKDLGLVPAGSHNYILDTSSLRGSSLTSGVYFYVFSGTKIRETRKLVLLN